MPGVGIGSTTSLLLASMDLKLVQLLRSAMNNGGAAGPGGVGPVPTIQPRPVHTPEPRIEPRRVIDPTPHFAPRKVHHPEPRFEAPECPPPAPDPGPRCTRPVLPPPWKTVPLEQPVEPRPVIKQVRYQVDIVHK